MVSNVLLHWANAWSRGSCTMDPLPSEKQLHLSFKTPLSVFCTQLHQTHTSTLALWKCPMKIIYKPVRLIYIHVDLQKPRDPCKTDSFSKTLKRLHPHAMLASQIVWPLISRTWAKLLEVNELHYHYNGWMLTQKNPWWKNQNLTK